MASEYERDSQEKTYKYLAGHYYSADVMKSRLLYWYRVSKEVIKSLGLEDVAVINTDALLRMILCYFADIARVRDFHSIELINESKRYAFGAFWFLKLHPVQITVRDMAGDNTKCAYINERIVLHVIASEFMTSSGNKEKEDQKKLFLRHLFHHLKYRTYTARTLELTLDALTL